MTTNHREWPLLMVLVVANVVWFTLAAGAVLLLSKVAGWTT